jgi:hypothetical protein
VPDAPREPREPACRTRCGARPAVVGPARAHLGPRVPDPEQRGRLPGPRRRGAPQPRHRRPQRPSAPVPRPGPDDRQHRAEVGRHLASMVLAQGWPRDSHRNTSAEPAARSAASRSATPARFRSERRGKAAQTNGDGPNTSAPPGAAPLRVSSAARGVNGPARRAGDASGSSSSSRSQAASASGMARNAATSAASATVSTGNRRAYAFAPRRFAGAPLERASFSSIAFVTKSITDVLTFTQCNFSSRCSGFGIRVASCTHTTSSLFQGTFRVPLRQLQHRG